MNHRFGIEPPDDGPRDDAEEGCTVCGAPGMTQGLQLNDGRFVWLGVECGCAKDWQLQSRHEARMDAMAALPRQMPLTANR